MTGRNFNSIKIAQTKRTLGLEKFSTSQANYTMVCRNWTTGFNQNWFLRWLLRPPLGIQNCSTITRSRGSIYFEKLPHPCFIPKTERTIFTAVIIPEKSLSNMFLKQDSATSPSDINIHTTQSKSFHCNLSITFLIQSYYVEQPICVRHAAAFCWSKNLVIFSVLLPRPNTSDSFHYSAHTVC